MKVETKAALRYQELIDSFEGDVHISRLEEKLFNWREVADGLAGGNFGG